jgi:hypothetical protein
VSIIIPVPDDADSPRFRTNIGTVHYVPEDSTIVWKIKQFGGGKEFLMRAELGLPSVRGDDDKGGGMMGGFGGSMGGVGAGKAKRPIQVKFEIPYFTTSGIQVRYLKIIEPKVRPCLISSTPDAQLFPFGLFGDLEDLAMREGRAVAGQIFHSPRKLQALFCLSSIRLRRPDRLTTSIVTVPLLTVGKVHHPIGRYCGQIAGCARSARLKQPTRREVHVILVHTASNAFAYFARLWQTKRFRLDNGTP